jgi:hypothetical protein
MTSIIDLTADSLNALLSIDYSSLLATNQVSVRMATNRVDKEKIFKDSSGYSGGWLKGVGE